MLRMMLAAALIAAALAEPLYAQSALERVRSRGRLRVGIDATYPPFGIAEGGEFSGFDVDIANAVARELGVRAELVNASFDGVFPALQNGSFDVVIVRCYVLCAASGATCYADRATCYESVRP